MARVQKMITREIMPMHNPHPGRDIGIIVDIIIIIVH